MPPPDSTTLPPVPPPGAESSGSDALDALVRRARGGDAAVLPELRAFLDDHPAAWRECGDLAQQAQDAWISLIAGPDLLARESLQRQTAALQAELAGPEPTPLERLLVGRVVACWLQVHYSDASVAQTPGVSVRQASFAQKRQDAAHRRYMTALGGLALIRRLVPGPGAAAIPSPPTPTANLPGDAGVRSGSEPPLTLFQPRPVRSANPLARSATGPVGPMLADAAKPPAPDR